MTEPGWDLYRAFLAVWDEGSLSGAARRLGLTQPTLGRQIAQLEASLGASLFLRSPHGLLPTDAARDLAPHAESMALAAAALARAASGGAQAEVGVVRLTASEIVGAEVLPPMLAEFRRAHSGIDIELSLSNAAEDMLRGQADIAVRMVRPAQDALIARHLGRVGLGLYAHRRYLGARPAPRTLEDLRGHPLIGFDRETPFLRRVRDSLPLPPGGFALRADSDLAQLALIRAGFGIGFIQHPIARRDPDLTPVAAEAIGFELDLWLVLHEDLRASRRVRLLFDHLVQALAGYLS